MPTAWDDPYDRDLAIRTIIGESAGNDEGMQAVANVIRNRVESGRWGHRPRDVVLSEGQFEPWQTRRRELLGYAPEDPAYQAAARALDASAAADLTGGATHFYAPDAQRQLGRAPPAWGTGPPMAQVGGHNFYAPEGRVQTAQMGGTDWVAEVGAAPPSSAAAADPARPRPVPGGGGVPALPLTDWAVEAGFKPPPPGPPLNTTIAPGRPLPTAPPRGVPPQMPEPDILPPGTAQPEYQGGYIMNMARQAIMGGTFNTADDLGAYLGAARALITDQDYGELLDELLTRNRARDQYFERMNPKAAAAAQIGGAMATLPVTGPLSAPKGAALGARMVHGAAEGAAGGVLSGFGAGEGGFENRMNRAAGEGAFGAAVGKAAPFLGSAARGGYEVARRPFRGAIGVEKEAVRRMGAAGFGPDRVDMAAAERQLADARDAGEPMIVADTAGMRGENTRALVRSATNTSPSARAEFEDTTVSRFHSQADRVSRQIEAITGTRKDTELIREELGEAARLSNAPRYKSAYAAGAHGIWTPELERLTASPHFRDAMKGAKKIGDTETALADLPPVRQPFEFSETGAKLVGADVPDLQYWDYVHRALQKAEGEAKRSGSSDARRFGMLDARLTKLLDAEVPEFKSARGGAATEFGKRDALDYGTDVLTRKADDRVIARELRRFTPEERALIRHSALNKLMTDIAGIGDRADVVNKIMQSPTARRRLEMVLEDPQQVERIQHVVDIEKLYQKTKNALGNSSTARQMFEMGLAGGGLTAIATGGDYQSAGVAGSISMLLKRGHMAIDTRVAQRVGSMMASNDPAVIRRVADMMAKNRKLREAVHGATRMLTTRTGTLAPEQEEPK